MHKPPSWLVFYGSSVSSLSFSSTDVIFIIRFGQVPFSAVIRRGAKWTTSVGHGAWPWTNGAGLEADIYRGRGSVTEAQVNAFDGGSGLGGIRDGPNANGVGFLRRIPVPIFRDSVIQVKVEAAQAPYDLGNLSEGSLISVFCLRVIF